MRTWSVSGTALALCTRSSSLSMRTSTSMALSLLAGADGGSRSRLRVELAEAPGDRRRDELVDVAAEGGDLLDAARGDEAVLRAGHHVHRLDVRSEQAVSVVHSERSLGD